MTHDHIGSPIDRRDALCGGGAVVFGVLVATLLGGAKPARAATIAGAPPELDRVAVRVVIDSYQIAVAPSAKAGNVAIERFGWGLSDQPPGQDADQRVRPVDACRDATRRRGPPRLVDYGFTPEALLNNAGCSGSTRPRSTRWC